jgi:hypothetical protein
MNCRILTARKRAVLCIATVVLLTGCGPQSPFEYVPVSGKVTYEDGSPVTVGKVFFVPDAPPKDGMHPRTATADLNADGTFASVTSYKPGDGIVPGKHKVAIMFAEDASGNPLVAKDYTSFATSPLVVDTADAPFDIKVPKP